MRSNLILNTSLYKGKNNRSCTGAQPQAHTLTAQARSTIFFREPVVCRISNMHALPCARARRHVWLCYVLPLPCTIFVMFVWCFGAGMEFVLYCCYCIHLLFMYLLLCFQFWPAVFDKGPVYDCARVCICTCCTMGCLLFAGFRLVRLPRIFNNSLDLCAFTRSWRTE